ncbi:GntR family transcriptional regulator [Bacillus sp. FJAT-27251]|uniref:GntR family transcriptional regulator n=1 Tax=Bacillus sp. FJAT-27251 TaxID=1684142 RepID=UPI0006A7834A|nr:GntR family transcriptional regulator [Bacillus sp. FJAT-27251]
MQTKYSRVQQDIKSKILDGTYFPHQKISSESELMKSFGVSRHTIRLAVGKLVEEGWLYRKQGAGTFCAERKTNPHAHSGGKSVAIITTYLSDYIFPSIIQGAESYLSKLDFQVSLYCTNNSVDSERRILESILTKQIDGIIIEPTKSALPNPNLNYYFNLERLNIPYIMINAYYNELEPPSLIMDDEKGGYLQTDYLIKLGHRNIAAFFKTDDVQGVKRMKGYIKAHRDNQMSIDPNNLVTYSSEDKTTRPLEKLKEILSSQKCPTAVVCYNDELAIRLLDIFRERNIHVPKDISLVGYDDSFLAKASEVKLTTVKHPKFKMGEDAAKMIVDLIHNKGMLPSGNAQSVPQSIVYEPKLIINQSTLDIRTAEMKEKVN